MEFNWALRLDRVVLAKPLLNFFLLSGEYDTLPFHDARALTVLSHYVRTLVEYLNQAVRFGPLEVERRKCGMVLLHLLLG